MTFYIDGYKITRVQDDKCVFYLMENNGDDLSSFSKKNKLLEEIDGYTITKDIRDSFKFPFVFENHMGIFISYINNKNENVQKSFISKPNKISCGPLFRFDNTLIGNHINLSRFSNVKNLYDKFNIKPTGKTICICENSNNIKWTRDLLLSQINVYPEYYNEKKKDGDTIYYFVNKPMEIRKKYSNSDIISRCRKCNEILNSITYRRTKYIIENMRNMENHMINWLYHPNNEILNIEPSILEFCRKILEMK